MKRIVLVSCISAILSAATAFPQGVRTVVSSVVSLSSEDQGGAVVSLRYNEAIAVLFPKDPTFIQGVEFELRIPKAFQGAESSIAWSLLSGISPGPTSDRFDYEARLIATQPLPSRVSMSLILPIIPGHGIKGGPFASLIPAVAAADDFPLMFKLSPIGKGLLPAMETAEFKLTVRPVLRDEGGIRVSVTTGDGAEAPSVSVFIDDRLADDPGRLILARKGPRVVRVSAEGYREEIVTVPVEAGVVSPLSVTLTPNAPFIAFQAPAGTYVTIDGKVVEPDELAGLSVDPGEHTLFFRIGDYSMTRKIMAMRGKVYSVVLSVELDVVVTP